ncbi:S-adenosyl-L-methionine-dependent methyltransferase [Acephala macrosclerotiorum]|nr:S-adenosyl-L-methionine-dependent methyltransferase [Acephala macrosclerotiorum]
MEKHYNIVQDAKEAERLRIQHEWVNNNLGFKIHPSISLPHSGSELRIADVGTGTGIFLLDIANDFPPSVQFHGFDITDVHFPGEEVPQNVKFHQHDMREPFPDEFVGQFDLVSLRLVVLGLRGNEWELAMTNLIALLKPGGHLQWMEPDHTKSQILNDKPSVPSAATRELYKHINQWFIENVPIEGAILLDLFRKGGLEVVTEEIFSTDRIKHESAYHTPMMIEAVGPLVMKWRASQGKITKEEGDGLVKTALEETRSGDIYQHSEWYFVVGRKP